MLITCPSCGFSKEVPENRIPRHNARVTCPECSQRFLLYPPGSTYFGEESSSEHETSTPPEEGTEQYPENSPKGGFWIRVVAALVDLVIVSVVQFTLVFLLIYTLGLTDGVTNGDTKELLAGLAGAFSTSVGLIYYVFFIGYCGQTPGKMALRIKVIRTTGEEIGYGRAVLREVIGKFISGIVLCIGYLWVAFDPQKQGWHDKIAGTYVIKLL
jgi:predicted Zn finger-like uncharacterized protein